MTEPAPHLFHPVAHESTAGDVATRLETLILDGVLRDGDRLPGERDLAQEFDVSRPVLREAIKLLEQRGLLVARHGGGTYVADIVGQVFSDPLTQLITRHPRAERDYLDYRRALEGMAASWAAERATDTDRAVLTRIIDDMKQADAAENFAGELAADIEFHTAIGEAAHNITLLHTLRACYRLLSEGILLHRQVIFSQPGARQQLLAQHVAIHAAILAGDASAARFAAEQHIDYVAATAEAARLQGERDRIAKLRLLGRQQRGQPRSPRSQETS